MHATAFESFCNVVPVLISHNKSIIFLVSFFLSCVFLIDAKQWLVKQGNCSFVNSDLPKDFRSDLLFQREQLPPLP